MDLKNKRKSELFEQKEKRKEEVIFAASEVFKEKNISMAKMTDIAQKAEVGVASVYRYFKTKLELVIEVMSWMWEEKISILYSRFLEDTYKELKGIDQIKTILNVFVQIYDDYPEFMSLLEQFDNYAVNEKIPLERLKNYELKIIDLKAITFDALQKGKEDGSIKENIDKNVFYIAVTHGLMSLSQKLILRGSILKSDSEVEGREQLQLMIQMALEYISKPK